MQKDWIYYVPIQPNIKSQDILTTYRFKDQ